MCVERAGAGRAAGGVLVVAAGYQWAVTTAGPYIRVAVAVAGIVAASVAAAAVAVTLIVKAFENWAESNPQRALTRPERPELGAGLPQIGPGDPLPVFDLSTTETKVGVGA